MKVSENGLNFIMEQEGVVLHIYNDQTGNPTIGIGHLITDDDPDFSDGITKEQALELLAKDVHHVETAINAYQFDLTQNQFDVLADFAFNCGTGALAKLIAHGLDQVPNQLPIWNKSRGKAGAKI